MSSYVPGCEHDVFISYAHLDNEPLVKGSDGWVTFFQTALRVRVQQHLGAKLDIYRDSNLQGNVDFSAELIRKLAKVAALISILTPRYVQSVSCLRELQEFWNAAGDALALERKNRIFKVIKTLVDHREHPPELQHCIGYEFFETNQQTGKFIEFLPELGPEAQHKFFARLDDLAQELARLLKPLHSPTLSAPLQTAPPPVEKAIYLAQTTRDLIDAHDNIRRELKDRGYAVLPDEALPIDDPVALHQRIRSCLDTCQLAVLLVGQNYGLVPDGETRSLIAIQHALVEEYAAKIPRLIWMPPGLQVSDERQLQLIEALRHGDHLQNGADLLETSIDELKQSILQKLSNPKPEPRNASFTTPHVYLIFAQEDAEASVELENYLYDQRIEVFTSTFEGEESERRATHQRLLQQCQGVIVYFNHATDGWLNSMKLDLQKANGLGREQPMAAQLIYLTGDDSLFKNRFRSLETPVVKNFGAFAAGDFVSFVAALRKGGQR